VSWVGCHPFPQEETREGIKGQHRDRRPDWEWRVGHGLNEALVAFVFLEFALGFEQLDNQTSQ
jgi:hypothetical protein